MPVGHLGIDVGGTKVAMRIEGGAGVHRAREFRWTEGSANDDMAALAREVSALRAEWTGELAAVGVAGPATVDTAGRVTAWPSRSAWLGLDLRAELTALFPGVPVAYADDGDLAALAEAHHIGCPDVVYAGVGTGIGGGIVFGGRLLPGPDRGSCELGHVIVDIDGPGCVCGRRGCVQALASGPAVLRRAGVGSFEELRTGWLAGTDPAAPAVEQAAAALATALAGVGELLRPQVAVVGGGFAAAMPRFVEAVARQVAALARTGHPPLPVRAAGLGALSSLHGAVLLARDQV